jgi:hypothetical protein
MDDDLRKETDIRLQHRLSLLQYDEQVVLLLFINVIM